MSPLALAIEKDDLLVCNTELSTFDALGINGTPTTEEEDWHKPLIQHLMDRAEPSDPIKRA